MQDHCTRVLARRFDAPGARWEREQMWRVPLAIHRDWPLQPPLYKRLSAPDYPLPDAVAAIARCEDEGTRQLSWMALSARAPLADVLAQPEQPWCMVRLSARPDIPWASVFATPQLGWRWHLLSTREDAIRVAAEHPDHEWDLGYFAEYHPRRDADLTVARIRAMRLDVWARCFSARGFRLATLAGVSTDDILAAPDLPWGFTGPPSYTHPYGIWVVSNRPDVTVAHLVARPEWPWCADGLSRNTAIDIDDILARPELPWWRWELFLNRPDLPAVFRHAPDPVAALAYGATWRARRPGAADAHPRHAAVWRAYDAQRPSPRGAAHVLATLDAPHQWANLALRPDMSVDDLLALWDHPEARQRLEADYNDWRDAIEEDGRSDLPSFGKALLRKPGVVAMALVAAQPDVFVKSDWPDISKAAAWEDVAAHPHAPWCGKALSSRTDLDWARVQELHWVQWDWHALTHNPRMVALSERERIAAVLEYRAIVRLQRAWRRRRACNADST